MSILAPEVLKKFKIDDKGAYEKAILNLNVKNLLYITTPKMSRYHELRGYLNCLYFYGIVISTK